MWAIENCRTSVLGGHEDVCLDCGHKSASYNSCRNRHCPKCQALDQARWLEQRKQRILATNYFHVVFTLPGELRPLARTNPRLVYCLLFQAASQTLLQLGRDPKRLGALLGITAVLHTWTRDLRFHPHLHCIVTGGGLSPDGNRWVDAGDQYLFPVRVLGRLFRGKFLDGLAKLRDRKALDLPSPLTQPGAFDCLRHTLFAKDWVVYAKRPFAGPQQIFSYLGRYTHRVAISNHRLVDVTDDKITISTRQGRTATMTPLGFIQRFLLHVLPKGFVKIRHYGLMASGNVSTLLPVARALLQPVESTSRQTPDPADALQWRAMMLALTGIDLTVCPACRSRRIRRRSVPRRNRGSDFSLCVYRGRGPPSGVIL